MANANILQPFILSKEGGKSKALTDRASDFPCPDPWGGVYGWHTNKGVTYRTFKDSAAECGYQPTSANFFEMPEWIWFKIFKLKYWDAAMADKINCQAVANLIVDWVWGAGKYYPEKDIQEMLNLLHRGHMRLDNDGNFGKNTVGVINGVADNKIFFGELIELHKEYLSDIVTRDKSQEANWAGWINRINDLTEFCKTMF